MKIRLLLVSALLALSATAAQAQGPYATAGGGVSIFHDSDLSITGVGSVTTSYDPGLGVMLGIGYDFSGVRLEGEYSFRNADIDKLSGPGGSVSISGADLAISSYMLNCYLDLSKDTTITPFIGAGVGMIKGKLDDNGDTLEDTVPGFQLMVGMSVAASKNLNLDLSYRLQGTTADFEKDGGKLSYLSSSLFANLRFAFQ